MSRWKLEHFDKVPAVWQEGMFFDDVWGQIATSLKHGDLNAAELKVLAELVSRMLGKPEARKALGIRMAPKHRQRNAEIADLFIWEKDYCEKSAKAAEATVLKKFPEKPEMVRKIIQSNSHLAPARSRMLARFLLENTEGKHNPKK